MNPYKILGIDLEASKAEVLKAFRKKAREAHPDRNKSPEAAKEFQKLLRARDILLEGNETPKAREIKKRVQKSPTSQKSPEEIKKEQELDKKAGAKKKLFKKESEIVKKHRQQLKTSRQRLSGKY